MKEPLDLSKYSIRTDLAVEAHQMLQESQEEQKGIQGVIVKEREEEGTIITKVTIDEAASEAMGKKPGNYLTLEVQGIRQQDTELQQKVERIFAKEFSLFLRRGWSYKRSKLFNCRSWELECNTRCSWTDSCRKCISNETFVSIAA